MQVRQRWSLGFVLERKPATAAGSTLTFAAASGGSPHGAAGREAPVGARDATVTASSRVAP